MGAEAVTVSAQSVHSSDDRQVFIHSTSRSVVRKFLTRLWLFTRVNWVPLTQLN